jgi:hypothetical protein
MFKFRRNYQWVFLAISFLLTLTLLCVYLYKDLFFYKDLYVEIKGLNYDRYSKTDSEVKCYSVKAVDDNELLVKFDFVVPSGVRYTKYENLLQTADENDGLRIEMTSDGQHGSLLYTDLINGQKVLKSISLTSMGPIFYDKDNHIEIRKTREGKVILSFNGASQTRQTQGGGVKISRVCLGRGFDNNRVFSGKIKNFELRLDNYYAKPALYGKIYKKSLKRGIRILAIITVIGILYAVARGVDYRGYLWGGAAIALLMLNLVASLFLDNYAEVTLKDFGLTSAYMLGAVFIMYTILFILNGGGNAGVGNSLLFSLALFFGGILFEYLSAKSSGLDVKVYGIVYLCAVFSLMMIVYFVYRNKNYRYALFFYVLAGFSVYNIYKYVTQLGKGQASGWDKGEQVSVSKGATRPDIYYIILDMYANRQVLKHSFDYDSEPLLMKYKSLGFHEVPYSTANYRITKLSVASTFNMQYIDFNDRLKDVDGYKARTVAQAYLSVMYLRNKVFDVLDEMGYKKIIITPEYPITASVIYNSEQRGVSGSPLLNQIFKNSFINVIGLNDNTTQKRDAFSSALKELRKTADDPSPKFVFMHLLVPHWDYVFDANGQYPSDPGMRRDSVVYKDGHTVIYTNKKAYVGQLEYITNALNGALSDVIAKSKTKPIIIITSDHGPYLYQGKSTQDPKLLPSPDNMKARYRNLIMMYYPDGDYSQVPDDLSLVNIFNVVFNKYFGSNKEMLENKNYLYPDYDDFKAVVPVTKYVQFSEKEKAENVGK